MSDWGSTLLVILVLGHFIVGFIYLIYKLSPRKGDKKIDEDEDLFEDN